MHIYAEVFQINHMYKWFFKWRYGKASLLLIGTITSSNQLWNEARYKELNAHAWRENVTTFILQLSTHWHSRLTGKNK